VCSSDLMTVMLSQVVEMEADLERATFPKGNCLSVERMKRRAAVRGTLKGAGTYG